MPTYRRQHPHTTRRLDFWNYEGPGPYAITICTDHRRTVLGRIEDGAVVLSLAGEIVKEEWTPWWRDSRRHARGAYWKRLRFTVRSGNRTTTKGSSVVRSTWRPFADTSRRTRCGGG